MNLQCVVDPPSALQDYVFWSHNDKVINYDNLNGRVQVNTPSEFRTISTLSISNIDASDSGNYTCKPSKAESASIRLHVLDGKHFTFQNIFTVFLSNPSNVKITIKLSYST